jgi:protein-S-isoprenylcysteine O-methyltransferase Ste14
MQPDELTLPLWRLLGRTAVRFLTFAGATDRWSHLSATEQAGRRARWPAWRRAVRPAGLGIFWFGVVCSVALGKRSGSLPTGLQVGWILLLLPIAVLGIRDWFREVPPQRTVPATSIPSAAGDLGLTPSRGSLPSGATEHPTA